MQALVYDNGETGVVTARQDKEGDTKFLHGDYYRVSSPCSLRYRVRDSEVRFPRLLGYDSEV